MIINPTKTAQTLCSCINDTLTDDNTWQKKEWKLKKAQTISNFLENSLKTNYYHSFCCTHCLHGNGRRQRFSTFYTRVHIANNACTSVPTVFRWHGKMEFKCHLHFLFSHDIEKQILFFVFASLWKTDMNFSFCFSFSHHFEKRIWISFFVFALLVIEKQIGVSFVIFAWIWKVD